MAFWISSAFPDAFRLDDDSYPELQFKITSDEIDTLKNDGVLSKDNSLSNFSDANSIAKLLYAMAWKNGDLKKIKHIIDGIISGPEDNKENGLVFYQFGKYLAGQPGEPIIDQHVLRAFGIYSANGDPVEIDRLKRLSFIYFKKGSKTD